ncbi:MAG: carbonic anhydrase [Gemmatimonadota bacterium]
MPQHLIEGLRRFRQETFPRYRDHYRRLVDQGQQPSTLFIGCADSRVLPDLLTDTGPGELFLLRNVGAFVPPFQPDGAFHGTAAGIEFAVLNLEVTDIVVCGHSHCGAVRALYDPPDPRSPHLARWLELGRDAKIGSTPDPDALRRAEQRSVALQLQRLTTYPFVQERINQNRLALHGWHYIIEDGRVLALDLHRQAFTPLT